MTYKDMCFCHASKPDYCQEHNIALCTKVDCKRHNSQIPYDKLPKWELFLFADLRGKCKECKYEQI